MIITCPHCQTKYQVTFEAIGSAGRKVQCAHCHRAWDQSADSAQPEPPSTPADEAALDQAMVSEERVVAAEKAIATPSEDKPNKARDEARLAPNAAELQKRQADFSKRHNAMISRLPLARLRRASRVVGILLLAGMIAGAYFARVPLVERYPSLAELYESVGLGVNVVGLDFSNLESVKTLSGGGEVLMVSAQIVGLEKTSVRVPGVLVSLLGADGQLVYEWSVTSRARDLMAGERATFDTRLSLPPSEAVRVRLRFAGGTAMQAERNITGSPAETEPSTPVEHH